MVHVDSPRAAAPSSMFPLRFAFIILCFVVLTLSVNGRADLPTQGQGEIWPPKRQIVFGNLHGSFGGGLVFMERPGGSIAAGRPWLTNRVRRYAKRARPASPAF